MTSCSVYKLGELAGGGDRRSGAGWAAGSENCIVYPLLCIFFLSVLLLCFFLFLCCSVELSLSQPTSFAFFLLVLLPVPLGREE